MKFKIENIVPVLNVSDMERSLSFYVDVLGFSSADWGTKEFTLVGRDNAGIYLCEGAQGQAGTWVWVGFDGDINALHEKLKSAGVKIKLPPTNFSWAYEMHVEDPDGHVLRFGTDPDQERPYESGF